MEKKIIYASASLIPTPVSGVLIFRLKGRTNEKFQKNNLGVVTKLKLSPVEATSAQHEYIEIEKLYTILRTEGSVKILNILYTNATSDQKIRITNAIDKTFSFYLAVESKNITLAKYKLNQLLTNNDITQEDSDLVTYYLELLENSY
jgi:hypothetical protein